MKFLVDVRITDREAAKPHLPAHLEYLNRHFENGDFILFGAYVHDEGGMLIAQSESIDSLNLLLQADPLKKGNCATWETFEFRVARATSSLTD